MPNLKWSNLSHLQLGQYAEYYAKMEFASYGFEVYTSEVDDHGVDFVVKNKAGKIFEVQVKSVRNRNYTYILESKIALDNSHLVCFLLFVDDHLPYCFLFPATVWNNLKALYSPLGITKNGNLVSIQARRTKTSWMCLGLRTLSKDIMTEHT